MSKVQKYMIAGFEDEKGLQTKDCGQPLEAWKGKKQIPLQSFKKEHSPVDTMILAP